MKQKNALKKALLITLAVMGGLVVLAILLGILNVVVADGQWNFGWTDYRYADEEHYTVGDGTVAKDSITKIEIDWIDGEVEIVPCEDAYLSLTETSENDLPDSARVHWRVSEDGSTLSVKYRASSFYFGSADRDKKLTVRVPETLCASLELLSLETVSTDVMVSGVCADVLEAESVSGNFIAEDCQFARVDLDSVSGTVVCNAEVTESLSADTTSGTVVLILATCPKSVDAESVSGEVKITLPKESSFTLAWDTVSGKLTTEFPLTQNGNIYTLASGDADIDIETVSGSLLLQQGE